MKKFLRVGVLLILVIGLAACGEKEPAENTALPVEDAVQETSDDAGPPELIDAGEMEFPLLLNVGKEIDIDLDGDGTVERILVEIIPDELGWNRYGLTINGVDQTDALESYSENPDTDWYAIVDLNTGDSLLEIALPYEGPSSDPSTTFLRYESGTLSSLGEVYGMVSEDHLTFDGAGVISSFVRLSVLQTWYAPVQWSIGADGVFEDIPQDLYYPFTDPYVSTKTALKELAGYADKSLDSSRSCVEIGTNMDFLATDDICWVQCKAETGAEFWLHLDEEFGFQVELFDGSYAWDGIEGLSMAD